MATNLAVNAEQNRHGDESHRPSSTLESIVHPKTGQLMAPGSKVWPYFIDHRAFDRHWIGRKANYPFHLTQASTQPSHDPSINAPKSEDNSLSTTFPPSAIESVPNLESQNQAPMPKSKKKEEGPKPKGRPKKNLTPSVDEQFDKLMQRKIELAREKRTSQSNIIQAAINVGMMFGWNKEDVLTSVAHLEESLATRDKAELLVGHQSGKMMDILGEMDRLAFEGGLKEAKALRNTYKGTSDVDLPLPSKSSQQPWRAPGLLILIQAAANVAFLKGLDTAAEENCEFDKDIFDLKVGLYLKVPTKACGEERGYLFQLSSFSSQKDSIKKTGACPGIERAIRDSEKKSILRRVRTQIEDGRKVIVLVTEVFGRDNADETGGKHMQIEKGGTKYALVNLDDCGFLILDYLYRKKVGFPILVSDQPIVDEEEEEEEEEEQETIDDARAKDVATSVGTPTSNLTAKNHGAHPERRQSLVVKLRYHKS